MRDSTLHIFLQSVLIKGIGKVKEYQDVNRKYPESDDGACSMRVDIERCV